MVLLPGAAQVSRTCVSGGVGGGGVVDGGVADGGVVGVVVVCSGKMDFVVVVLCVIYLWSCSCHTRSTCCFYSHNSIPYTTTHHPHAPPPYP